MHLHRRTTLVATTLLLASTGLAHDFWVEPTEWRPGAPAVVGLNLFVGHDGERELLAREAARVERFFAARPGADGEARATIELPGAEGRAPAGYLRVERTGLHAVGYRSRDSLLELEPAKFEAYLVEEGLERVLEERARRGERGRPGREAYSRCAKTLLLAGDGSSAGFDEPLGLTLEIVPLDDPYTLAPGSPLRVRLLYRGRPCAGLLVEAEPLGEDGAHKLQARTNEEGVAVLERPEGEAAGWAGNWLIAAVHMVRAEPELEQDWVSLWASLTFEHDGTATETRSR